MKGLGDALALTTGPTDEYVDRHGQSIRPDIYCFNSKTRQGSATRGTELTVDEECPADGHCVASFVAHGELPGTV